MRRRRGGREIWTQGGGAFARTDSRDAVVEADNLVHVSDQATIWRWREAFQHDFAARMDWTIKPFASANHPPVAVIGDLGGRQVITIDGEVGKPIRLDASASRDADGQPLRFHWFSYPEAGYSPGVNMADVRVTGSDTAIATITPVVSCRQPWLPIPVPCPGGIAHVILAVSDNGSPSLTSYRRIIVHVAAPATGS